MTDTPLALARPSIELGEGVAQLDLARDLTKCRHCGCLHGSLRAIETAYPPERRPAALAACLDRALPRLADVRYDCIGCDPCHPALAVNALGVEGEACASSEVQERDGWPPLPGSFTVLRFLAPVAICTLTDEGLARELVSVATGEIALVGTLQTENLGIERLIQNCLANLNIRFVLVCGPDSRRVVGHLPGASLVALARSGVDERMQIRGAPGRRPALPNLSREQVEHFRRTIEVVDLIGETDPLRIMGAAMTHAARNPGPADLLLPGRGIPVMAGYLPARMVPDPAGYLIVCVDSRKRRLLLEHYRNEGVLDLVIEGTTTAELCTAAIDRGLVSRLDHAAYLGKELARAEQSLRTGSPYVQDAAPEQCGATGAAVGGGGRAAGCACGEINR